MNKDKYNERRNRVLSAIPKRYFKDHYNPLQVLKMGTAYSMIIALRNNGKSTSMLILILYAWQFFEYPSCWVRRLKDNLSVKNMGHLFDKAFKIVPNKKKYDGIEYKSGVFRGYWLSDKNRKTYDNPFCYTHSLSAQESQKGTKDIPNLLFIVFDEFMARDYYLPNEFITFVNALSTIFRECYDASIVMLGNPVTWACPYFDEMGIKKVRDIPQGTIKLYKAENSNTSVALEICGKEQQNSKTDIINDRFFGFQNNQIESIRSGAWELPMFPHLSKENNGDRVIDRSCYLVYDNETFTIEIRQTSNGDIYAFIRPYTSELDLDDVRVKRVYQIRDIQGIINKKIHTHYDGTSKIDRVIWGTLYRNNNMFYSSNMVGETVRLFLQNFLSSINT